MSECNYAGLLVSVLAVGVLREGSDTYNANNSVQFGYLLKQILNAFRVLSGDLVHSLKSIH